MKERPILFRTAMVQTIIEGRKTQTRRVIKCPSTGAFILQGTQPDGGWWPYFSVDGETPDDGKGCERAMNFRCGQVGDKLWVKEKHYRYHVYGKPLTSEVRYLDNPPDKVIDISRTYPPIENQELKILDLKRRKREGWILSSSLFMPRWASRLTLEITEIRVQRLQEISEADAIAEGMDDSNLGSYPTCATWMPPEWYKLPQEERWDKKWYPDDERMKKWNARNNFICVWEHINGKTHPWESNPWVWVINFKKL